MSDITIVEKGQEVKLRGKNDLEKVLVGLGWDPAATKDEKFDLDASVIGRNISGKAILACYYGAQNPAPWIKHSGDSLEGIGEGDDETVTIDLTQVPQDIVRLDIVVHVFKGAERNQHFGRVNNAFARLVDPTSDTEKVRYDLTNEDAFYKKTGMILGIIKRDGPAWSFVAVGEAKDEYATLTSFTALNLT